MSTDPDRGSDEIGIEVAYALPDRQSLLKLAVRRGTTVIDAIEQSGIRKLFPGMEISEVGIFSRKVAFDHELEDGDRIEIYRPLIASPQEMRKKRAMS
ncbi:MAG: RnfH family protein [Xanthomonadales bacterium]|jgi:putative ubiquitin-RnfH superfamily antitoxin RatB of RatAB toxin-antitoxin module|nr:RnfH family protein [Xanthomonadales bacterium]MDH3941996.1 RnfH family protein [Xanthomonadales bacterium]MDH4000261.1 RnfH family protein [Xanthomonadales bacterium]